MDDSSDDDFFEASQNAVPGPADLRWDTQPKLVVNIPLLGLRPENVECRHTEPCRCSTIVATAASRTHQRYSPGRFYSRIMPGDKCALSWLKNDTIASVLPGPLGEVDIVACSAGGLAHVVALGSPRGTEHPLAEFWGSYQSNRASYRSDVWDEVKETMDEEGVAAWLQREGTTAEKAGKALVAPVSGIVSPMAWVGNDGNLPRSRPLGPVQELVRSDLGRQLCLYRYYAICEVMMTAVYGARYMFTPDGFIAALKGVYDAVLEKYPEADADKTVEDALDTLLGYNATVARDGDPYDIDVDTGGPGDNWTDYLTLCIPPRHFMSANRSYAQKTLAFVDRHDAIDESVLNAASVFHAWYEQQPNAAKYDRLGILNIIASRGAHLQSQPAKLRKDAERASPAERRDMLARAKRMEYSEVLGGAFSELISAHFEGPIIAELANKIPSLLPVRLVACKGDALVYLVTTADGSRNFEPTIKTLDLSAMSPYALVEATCDARDGDDTFGPEGGRARKRKRANNEEGKVEKRDRLLQEIKDAIIQHAENNGLIRIPNTLGEAVVHHRVDGFPGCVYTQLVRSNGSTVGEVQTHDRFVQMALSSSGPNGGLPHQNLLNVWQNDTDGVDAIKKKVIYGWLATTHHEKFPLYSRGCVARGTWVALQARTFDTCKTGLLHVIALKRIGKELFEKYGFAENVEEAEDELNARWAEYWYPLEEGAELPACPDRFGQPPLITRVTHVDKAMPDRISLDVAGMKVLGILFPHMFDLRTADGQIATKLCDADNVTNLQLRSAMLICGIFGFALIPGLCSPKMVMLLEGDSNCGKSCIMKIIAMWLGLEDLTSIQNVKGGDKFSLMGLFGHGYNKWAVCVDDLNVSLRDLCEDWKQLVTGGPVAFQAKNVNQTVANVYNEQLVTQSQQDMSSAAGFIVVTTNHVNIVLGGDGPTDPGLARRLLPINFQEARRGPLDTRIEELAEGSNGNCIDECLAAIVLSGQVEAYQQAESVPFHQLLRDPDTGKSWIETRQTETIDRLTTSRYEEYTDFIAGHLEHRRGNPTIATYENHLEGAAVDLTLLWSRCSAQLPRANKKKFEEAVLNYFNNSLQPVSPPVTVMREVRVCATIPNGGMSGIASLQVHKFAAGCCDQESRRRTKRTVFTNVCYKE